MAENHSDFELTDHPTIELKAKFEKLEDPLDPQLLENLTLFFKVKGVNPVPLISLYKECITSLGKDWEPFIGTLGSTLNKGAVACEYLMLGYRDRMAAEQEIYTRHQESWKQQARQINHLSKAFAELLRTVESTTQKLNSIPSSAASDVSTCSSLCSDLASLNQFIWEDGKSYKSTIGILTANRNGSIDIILSSSEFQGVNVLKTLKMKPENWEFVLNRDLSGLTSYLSLNSEIFDSFNSKDTTEKAELLKDLASHVSVNMNQWINALAISTGRPRYLLPFKTILVMQLELQGPLPLDNVKELSEIICLMVLKDSEISLNMSKLAKPFLWHFMCLVIKDDLTIKNEDKNNFMDEASLSGTWKGFSDGLCEETLIELQSVKGKRTWQLTDNCDKYVTVVLSYQLEYSTFPCSEKKMLKEKGFKNLLRGPSADVRARLLELETELLNIKTIADQCQFLNFLLYEKRDDVEVALIPMDFDLSPTKE